MSATDRMVNAATTPRNKVVAEFEGLHSENNCKTTQLPDVINHMNGNDQIDSQIPEGDLLNIGQYETFSDVNLMESLSFDANDLTSASIQRGKFDYSEQLQERNESTDLLLNPCRNGFDKTSASIDCTDNDIGSRRLQYECGTGDESDKDYKPQLEPGDHVIRWKLLKAVLYPIQIHGIVLNVQVIEGEVDENGNPKINVTIADFGYTKSQSYDEEQKKKGKGISLGINKMMQTYYNIQKIGVFQKDGVSKTSNQEQDHLKPGFDDTISSEEKILDDHTFDDKLKHNPNGKRFRIIILTEPKQIKKWSKINYGSIFSPDGKFAKMKSWIKSKSFKRVHTDDEIGLLKDDQSLDMKYSDENLENVMSPTSNNNKGVHKGKAQHKISAAVDENENGQQSTTLKHLVTGANNDESENDSRHRLLSRMKSKSNRTLNVFSKSWFGGSSRRENRNEKNSSFSPLISPSGGSTEFEGDDKSSPRNSSSQPGTPLSPSIPDEAPKLPKPDPRKIVLARTKYILSQQDLPESESSLPPYHVLYSNSECLAVWCKTGSFSTLQAAVFLHSTAVGNAKSTVGLAAAIGATQPWLIPLVGIYGIVSIGMPYYLLKRCHVKWKEGEKSLTDGFWSSAEPEVFVAAIENWSRLVTSSTNV